jgi:hypothetical protein
MRLCVSTILCFDVLLGDQVVAPREEPCSKLEMEDFWRANIPSSTTSTNYVCAPLPPGAPGVTAILQNGIKSHSIASLQSSLDAQT